MRVFAFAAGCVLAASCRDASEPTANRPLTHERVVRRALRQLRAREGELRRAALGVWRFDGARIGVDPVRLCALGDELVGLLQGSSELVLMDGALNERSRARAPNAPAACAALGDSELAVIGALPELWIYRRVDQRLELSRRVALPGALSPRAIAANGRTLYVADQSTNALYVVRNDDVRTLPLCRRPIALALAGSNLIANCLYDHALSVRPLAASGQPLDEAVRIENAGPFWAMAALASDDGLLLAASGVENRPLERFEGAFGYIDSFAYLFRVRGTRVERLWSQNVSEHSLLVPKAIQLERGTAPHDLVLFVSSAGSDGLVRFDIDSANGSSQSARFRFAPGISDLVRVGARTYGASPLLDAWVSLDAGAERATLSAPVATTSEADPTLRLGEALAFTSLIAPEATSEGHASRFTCETCHFEGTVDARVHHTGRGDVHVVTRPLLGLLRNAPHFSRALDPDLTSVSHNEFRVASLGNPHSPWFTLRSADYWWLARLGVRGDIAPQALRAALLEFLARFEFGSNSRVRTRMRFSSEEARGAELFSAHCESCHAARLFSDDAASRVAFEGWELSLFELGGPIVWARGDYALCGVLPYVNERGTRIASLRRVADKFPYFTNGSARSLDDVLERAAYVGDYFSHAAPRSGFSADERRALKAFLELL